MKVKISPIASIVLMSIALGCNFNYSESGKEIDPEKDANDLFLAKESLRLIEQSKTDSLKELLNDEVLKNSNPKSLQWLFKNGKRIIENNEYPNDSIITVSTSVRKSITGEEKFKEFNFPFISKENPDSTMYFKITVVDGEINKLVLSTGMRFKKIN